MELLNSAQILCLDTSLANKASRIKKSARGTCSSAKKIEYVPVVSQVILPAEGLPADVAGIRPLVRVGPFVYQKIITFRELSVAKFTNELFLGARGALLPAGRRRRGRRRRRRRARRRRTRRPLPIINRVHYQARITRVHRETAQALVVVQKGQVLLDLLGQIDVLREADVVLAVAALLADLRAAGGDLQDVDPIRAGVDVRRDGGEPLQGDVGLEGLQVQRRRRRRVGRQQGGLLQRVHHGVLQGERHVLDGPLQEVLLDEGEVEVGAAAAAAVLLRSGGGELLRRQDAAGFSGRLHFDFFGVQRIPRRSSEPFFLKMGPASGRIAADRASKSPDRGNVTRAHEDSNSRQSTKQESRGLATRFFVLVRHLVRGREEGREARAARERKKDATRTTRTRTIATLSGFFMARFPRRASALWLGTRRDSVSRNDFIIIGRFCCNKGFYFEIALRARFY